MERLKKTERMLRIWLLLLRNPLRFTSKDLAQKFGVNVRTIYRDLVTLGNELMVPVYEERARWAVREEHFLPPIRFTVSEALNIFLAARLMLGYSHRYDPNVDSTFSVLASVLPAPLREQVQKTLDWMRTLPKSEVYLSVLAKLAEAWTSQHRAKITTAPCLPPRPPSVSSSRTLSSRRHRVTPAMSSPTATAPGNCASSR
jgi:predicted DNA-binding transcriptional regulator YafY